MPRGKRVKQPRRTPATARRARAARAPAAPRERGAPRATETALVAVDIGNSDTVVGWFRGAALDGFWRLTSGRRTEDEITLLLRELLRGRSAGGAVLSSVVPALTLSWVEALTRLAGTAPLEVTAATAGVPIRYLDKGAVGADRLANAVAMRTLYGTPAIVVDLGTATTFDCISSAGSYLGGVIAPGVGASSEALFTRAARLPRVELRRPERAIGRTTEESLRAGVLWGAAGQVDALVRRIALEMKGTPHVLATGGWATLLAPLCETINRVDEGLTLKGMQLIWEARR